eukprot:CAMPEP_0197578390 /NCGR_PEP_ID=MMETSP1326-20131121/2624_1 /TAXON_ID=1155430 /ORGANISM="Genus nov. species nov., Strain RCC2288" /LENGTH=205 /DNA_ID=CAMNT_0043141569 /DNA_START=161 /DNA_END=774 /DNA_ORIENTATION=+
MKMPSFDTQPQKYGGFGKAMLIKMGWNEGEGLGKNKHGMSEALKAKRREDLIGIGAEDSLRYKWEEKWWEGHFKDAASACDKFASAVAANAADDSDDGADSDSDSDSDSEMARNLASCATDSKGQIATGNVKGRDGIFYSGKKSDFDLAKDLAKDGWGNWGRAKGKLARIAKYEEEQLAKYGIQTGESTAATAAKAAAAAAAAAA